MADTERVIETVCKEMFAYDNAFDQPLLTAVVTVALEGVCPECGDTRRDSAAQQVGAIGQDCRHPYHDAREKMEGLL